MKKSVLHRATTRGHANFSWLDTYYSFSFANYYDPQRMNFGALRVLNDDKILGGGGFGTHPHDNMEIVSVGLAGEMEHKDSMNNVTLIRQNDIQIMSAGKGISHSEYNKSATNPVELLQIWVFPKERNITPRYDQKNFDPALRINKFQNIVFPIDSEEDLGGVRIFQNSWFYMTSLSDSHSLTYKTHLNEMGVYVFVLNGTVNVGGISLNKRDGAGFWEGNELEFIANSESVAEILIMEVPV